MGQDAGLIRDVPKAEEVVARIAHTHDEEWPLTPGDPVELDIEIWLTSIAVPPDYRLALTVHGKDYEVDGRDAAVSHSHTECTVGGIDYAVRLWRRNRAI